MCNDDSKNISLFIPRQRKLKGDIGIVISVRPKGHIGIIVNSVCPKGHIEIVSSVHPSCPSYRSVCPVLSARRSDSGGPVVFLIDEVHEGRDWVGHRRGWLARFAPLGGRTISAAGGAESYQCDGEIRNGGLHGSFLGFS